ncbi:GerMN domain-containing protein [bacterium]|nr:GerMN domain-containing protein [bacterium]
MSRSKKKWLFLLVLILVAGLIGALFYLKGAKKEELLRRLTLLPQEDKIVISLYFSTEDAAYLAEEKRDLPKGEEVGNQIKLVVKELIKGPTLSNLSPTLPKETVLREVYLEEGTCFLDFGQELRDNHPGGSSGEELTVFSLVNTLTHNFSQIERVQILIEGKEVETLVGHIDLSSPLREKKSLLAPSPTSTP